MSTFVPSSSSSSTFHSSCHCGYCAVLAKIDGLYVISSELEKKIDGMSECIERIEEQLGILMNKMDDALDEMNKYEGESQFGFLKE